MATATVKEIMLIAYEENGVSKSREATPTEIAEIEAAQAAAAVTREIENTERISKATAKAALLAKLGIPADEAALLLG